jgi:hypothetical protein
MVSSEVIDVAVEQQVGSEVQGKRARFLKVKVVDMAKEGRPAVNVTMPISVVKFGMKMAQAFSPEMKDAMLDWESIVTMVDSGEIGKIVEVHDEGGNKTVEVWVE